MNKKKWKDKTEIFNVTCISHICCKKGTSLWVLFICNEKILKILYMMDFIIYWNFWYISYFLFNNSYFRFYGTWFRNTESLTDDFYMCELFNNTWSSITDLRAARWTQGGGGRQGWEMLRGKYHHRLGNGNAQNKDERQPITRDIGRESRLGRVWGVKWTE